MKTYTVHHPTGDRGDIVDAPEKLIFVKEGLCWPALFIPFLWALFRRMWIVAAIYFVAVMVLNTIVVLSGVPGWIAVVANLGFNVFMWLEGNELRRWSLERRGIKLLDIVSANNFNECERLFLARFMAAGDVQNDAHRPARASSNALKFAGGDTGMSLYPQFGNDK